MSLLSLPNEILQEIGALLDSQQAIASLVAANRRLWTLFLPLLYRFNYDNNLYPQTAEHWAAKSGRLDTMKRVNELGLHNDYDYVFDTAIKSGHFHILGYLLDTKHPKAPPINDLFLSAAKCYCIPTMQYLIGRGVIVNEARTYNGLSAVHWAANADYVEALTFLVDHGADVDLRDTNGNSPLSWASDRSSYKAIEFLLENGVDINAKCVSGNQTVLYAAVLRGATCLAKFLLEKGADPFIKFDEGNTALHMAATKGLTQFAACVLRQRRSEAVSVVDDRFGGTPLQYATIANNMWTAETFIKASTIDELNYRDRNGRTAVFYAARYNQPDVLDILLEHHADPTIRDRWGASAIFAAVRNDKIPIVERLLEFLGGECFDERDDFGRGIVWWATRSGNPKMLSLLTKFARECEYDVEIAGSEYFADEIPILHNIDFCWCDICTRSIGGVPNGMQCTSCFNQHFVICEDCVADGRLTCEPGHREEKWVPFTSCRCPRYNRR